MTNMTDWSMVDKANALPLESNGLALAVVSMAPVHSSASQAPESYK